MTKRIITNLIICPTIIMILSGLAIARDSRTLLREAIKEKTPSESGPGAKYVETSLKEKGHKCFVNIVPSRKYKGKYFVSIQQQFSKTHQNFTGAAIIAAAILSKNIGWKCSDLFLGYSATYKKGNKNIGWAVISIGDCIEARKLLLSTNSVDKFESYWNSRIKYISDSDPEPNL